MKRTIKTNICHLLLAITVSLMMSPVSALADVDTNPREGIPLPGGTNVGLLYWKEISSSDYYSHGKKVTDNADLKSQMFIPRYVHYWDFKGWTPEINVLLPFGTSNLEFGSTNDRSSGLGDVMAQVAIATPDLIKGKETSYWVWLGFYLTAPIGDYNAEKAVNLGSNRWSYRLEFTPIVLKYGPFLLEQTNNVIFYSDNTDYSSRHVTQSKDPLFSSLVHLSYEVNKSFWLALSYDYHTGGETTVNGIKNDDKTKTSTLMATASVEINPRTKLMFSYATDVSVENGFATNIFTTRLGWAF
jgi:hypothetical protein